MSERERLLKAGRAILASREAKQQQEFQQARQVALRLLDPTATGWAEVAPLTYAEAGDFPRQGTGHPAVFAIEPFAGVPIQIKLQSNSQGWFPVRESGGWEESRRVEYVYFVACDWTFDPAEDHGVYVREYQGAETLAEALALAERFQERRAEREVACQKARQRYLERQEQARARAIREATSSVGQRLVALIQEICCAEGGE